MSWQKCATINCPRRIRAGLRRSGVGTNGQELADGRHCARCRARHGDSSRRPLRVGDQVIVVGGKLDGLRGTLRAADTIAIGPITFTVNPYSLRRKQRDK